MKAFEPFNKRYRWDHPEALTWKVITTMLVCNTLFVYAEVEE